MKRVALTQIRAMSREIVAVSGNDGRDVGVVMALGGVDPSRHQRRTSIDELNNTLLAVERAVPSMREGMVGLEDTEWLRFQDLYYNRVLKRLFM